MTNVIWARAAARPTLELNAADTRRAKGDRHEEDPDHRWIGDRPRDPDGSHRGRPPLESQGQVRLDHDGAEDSGERLGSSIGRDRYHEIVEERPRVIEDEDVG